MIINMANKKLNLAIVLASSLIITSCARNDGAAPIVSIDGQSQSNSNSSVNNGSGAIGTVPQYPVNDTTYNNSPQTVSSQPVYNQPVATQSTLNGRDYNQIPKGSYSGSNYTVQPGDTMYYIAWITGVNVNELANLNNLTEPYHLTVGQQLQVPNQVNNGAYVNTQPVTSQPQVVTTTSSAAVGNTGGKMLPSTSSSTVGSTTTGSTTAQQTTATPIMSTVSGSQVSSSGWRWPTQGQVIQGFSNRDGGSKGIDIAGQKGQAINAASAGKVVYAGNALAGYGNLLIIKHSEEYLSAYAHNDTLLVKEGEEVKSGQQIATMGNSGAESVKLHFEIRKKGVSVDPMGYLPKK